MNQKYFLIGALIVSIFILLFLISLLGENHRAREIVNTYIEELVAGNFSSTCIPVKLPPQQETDTQGLTCEDKNFLFMISLLSKSDFKHTHSVSFEAEVNRYWIPYFTEDSLKVGLTYTLNDKTTRLSNLFIIRRKGWSWSVSEIQVTNQELTKTFTYYQNSLDLDKYVLESLGTYELQNINIDLRNLSPTDKMVLKYNLQKVYQHLE